jgi:N-acetylglucosamine-6-phosphate deacetylase
VTPELAPGLVDLQVNGIGDIDLVHADADGWAEVGRVLLTHGVTAYCPTFVSAPLDAYGPALDRAAAAQDAATASGEQASILGVHLEGPFLGDAPGAHAADLLRPADVGWLDGLLAGHRDLVRLVTLAPEADPGLDATRLLAGAGVVVALGHSRAGYDDVVEAVDAGASVVTHLFNGMGPLLAREPGLAGAALTDPRLTSTVIADLVHVHPAGLHVAFGAAGGAVIVSDSVACVGGVGARGGAACLADGTLAGSTTLLDDALQNLARIGVDRDAAVHAATTGPARVLGIERDAFGDRVALDPDTLEVRAVWLGGEQVSGE